MNICSGFHSKASHTHAHTQLQLIIALKQTPFWFKCTAESDNWVTSGIKPSSMTDSQLVILCRREDARAAAALLSSSKNSHYPLWAGRWSLNTGLISSWRPWPVLHTTITPAHCTAAWACKRVGMKTNACDWRTINLAQLIHFFNYPFSAVLLAWMPCMKNYHTLTCVHTHTPNHIG